MKRQEFLGHLAAFSTILVWGLTFVSTKILLNDFTPLQILFCRFFIGWLALWCASPHILKIRDKHELALFAGAGLTGVTLYFLLENIALTISFAANVGIIVTVAPFFTGLLAWKFLAAEKPGANFFIGFLLAISGIALISLNGAAFSLNPLGDILALLAAISWAAYSIFTKKLSAFQHGALATTRGIFFWGLLFMLPGTFFGGFSFNLSLALKPINLLNILFLGLWASALCFATWTFSLKCLGAIKTSAYIYLVPVVTVFAAAAILHEPITGNTICGAFLTITGLFLAEFKFGRKKTIFAKYGRPR